MNHSKNKQKRCTRHLPTRPRVVGRKSVLEQPLKEHGKYMLSLHINGSMKLAALSLYDLAIEKKRFIGFITVRRRKTMWRSADPAQSREFFGGEITPGSSTMGDAQRKQVP